MNIMNLYVYENRSMSNDLSKPLMLENLNVDTVKVHIPKEIDGTDMGTWAWWFVYLNAKKEKYSIPMTLELTTNDEGEEEYTSDVSMDHGFTGKHGRVSYAIEAIQADGSGTITGEWHTKTYKEEIVYTLQGNQTEYDESESDIISALISRVNELIQSGAEIAEIAETIENAAETAQEVIASIPADYSALSDQVDTNTAAIAIKADQATTYTKTEVDQMISDVEVETDTTLEITGAPADAAETGRQIGLLKADLDEKLSAFADFFKHLNGTFDDGNGDQYIQKILDAIDVAPPIPPEPIVPLTLCATPFSSSSTNLYSDNGVTKKTDLKSSGGIYYYLSDVVEEETIYHVTTIINTSINTHQYKAVYEYSAELISGAGTGNPTIYNITNLESDGIMNASIEPLTSDFVYETDMTVQAGRQLAVLFYRDQSTAISSITAQKVVN